MKKFLLLAGLVAASSVSYATPLNQSTAPHFYVMMENHSDKDASISFQKVVGEVDLDPVLADHTPLPAHKTSAKYGVNFHPLGKKDNFNIVFTGKEDCAFNIAFYSQGNPKITVSGLGCFGGGYSISGDTLFLYISDINLKNK